MRQFKEFDIEKTIRGVERNDRTSESRLFDYCKSIVYASVRRFNLDNETTEDLVMESLCRVFKNISKFKKRESIRSFNSFLWIISGNTVKTYLKNHGYKIKKETSYENLIQERGECDYSLSSEHLFHGLSKIESEVANLYYFDGKSLNEISDMLSITQNCAKIRLHRASKKMKVNANS